MKISIPNVLQPTIGIAALIIAPNRVLRGMSKKDARKMRELEEMVRESQYRREMAEAARPIRVVSTRI